MEFENNKLVSREYSRKVLGLIIGMILFFFLIACCSFYAAEKEFRFYFLATFSLLLTLFIYFITLFNHYKVEIDIEKQTILIQYVYSFKKSKTYKLTEIFGYYIYADGGLRRIVLVLKDKSELKFSDSYDFFFKHFQTYIFDNYKMISHKNYKVYNDTRKANELRMYNSLPSILIKSNYEIETFHLHALWQVGLLGLLFGIYYFDSILNLFNLICCAMIVISYLWIKSRKAKLNSKNKDEWDNDLFE